MKFTTYKKSNTEEIVQVFTQTFTDSEGKEEATIVGGLAADLLAKTSDAELDVFIATQSDKIIGAVIFSKLYFDEIDVNAAILSPMAISTSHQKKGVGQQLINFAIEQLKEKDIELLMTYGDINFYSKVGFVQITEDQVKAPLPLSYPEGWLGQSLSSNDIKPMSGNSHCVTALDKPEIW